MSQTAEPILPSTKVMTHACKLACSDDKPIMMDYWMDSQTAKVMSHIGCKLLTSFLIHLTRRTLSIQACLI